MSEQRELTNFERLQLMLLANLFVHLLIRRRDLGPGCHCQNCDPLTHLECSADCLEWDCTSSWACCNGDCDDRPA